MDNLFVRPTCPMGSPETTTIGSPLDAHPFSCISLSTRTMNAAVLAGLSIKNGFKPYMMAIRLSAAGSSLQAIMRRGNRFWERYTGPPPEADHQGRRPILGTAKLSRRSRFNVLFLHVFIGQAYNATHHGDRLNRPFSDCCFTGQHHRIDPLKDGVGDVAHLGARWAWRVDHTLQHLCGDDYGFAEFVAQADDLFLENRGLQQDPSRPQGLHGQP